MRLRPFDRGDLGIERGVSCDLVEPAVDRGERDRHVAVARRCDLNEQDVGRRGLLRQPQQRRIAAEAAVPIGFALDLDGAVNQGRTGRGQRDVGGDGLVAEDLLLAVADPCRRDQKLRAARIEQRGEIDVARQRLPQRIEIDRIEPAGAQGRAERDRASRRREAADQHQRAERGLVHQAEPESAQPCPRSFAAALREAGGEQERIDGAGTGAADGVDLDRLFQQPFQHAR